MQSVKLECFLVPGGDAAPQVDPHKTGQVRCMENNLSIKEATLIANVTGSNSMGEPAGMLGSLWSRESKTANTQ